MQEIFDMLYDRSKNNHTKGLRLYEIITSKENILLAYRNIKTNKGSRTEGTDGLAIEDYKYEDAESFVKEIRKTLEQYKPQTVRRVEIPKPNGKKRPLGIPTMRDRLIQQMFKQVLEPICEAKFYNHSYGFRPNRSVENAMARCQQLINISGKRYLVDIDIEGFFDNVNHTKLIKQLYNIGIKDRRVLSIISKMLKALIEGVGIPTKGTPQGGILSPLLSNVALNDLDWWIANQWEHMITQRQYSFLNKYRALRKTSKLKEMYIVRYADDFKIFADSYESSKKIFHAVKGYLENHLKLNISKEKSKITNICKGKSEFLGFKIKATKKANKFVAHTYVADKQIDTIQSKTRALVKEMQKDPKRAVLRYNQYILGIRNYYINATHVNKDFSKIAHRLRRILHNRLKNHVFEVPIEPSSLYTKLFKNNYKTYRVSGVYLYPIADIQTKNVQLFNQNICNYTKQGRLNHKELGPNIVTEMTKMVMVQNSENLEYSDNKISRYSMQNGKCSILGTFHTADEIHCHHILPKHLGGTDKFDNLVIVNKLVHKFIHATKLETIERYKELLQLSSKQLKKLNMFRQRCNLDTI
jgi:group II intron reverse transcriptase/maturase